jgi:hypothetical protein
MACPSPVPDGPTGPLLLHQIPLPSNRRSFLACELDALSAVEDRPADVVPQPLVVEDELANRLRELVALPPALESPCALALSFRCGGARGLDRVGGGTKFVRGDVRDSRGLANSVRGMPCRPS